MKDMNTSSLTSDETKKMLRNYWFLSEREAEYIRMIARVEFHKDYGGK